MNGRSPTVEALARRNDLYLLTHDDDVPFVQDGVRDGERIRGWMTAVFAERLTSTDRCWTWLRGTTHAARLQAATSSVKAMLARGWTFRPPLG